MYQIITNQYLVITIYASDLKQAIDDAHAAELVILSITELKYHG